MACSACEKRKKEMAARKKANPPRRNANGVRVPPRTTRKATSAIRPIKPTARR